MASPTQGLSHPKPLKTPVFDTVSLAQLRDMDAAQLDELPFGVVGLDSDGIVEVYNRTEATNAGLDRDEVIGSSFFLSVAQCMNNFMVAQRFEDEDELDTVLAYILTFRMRPTPVRLRLLKQADHGRRFVLVER